MTSKLDLSQFFSDHQWQIILASAEIAYKRSWQIYAVGGVIRDCLRLASGNLHPSDIDLVVDRGEKSGIEVAIALHKRYPQAKLQTYPKFQTALLTWQDFSIDIATARTEIYPSAGVNPQVQASSIQQDLYRRDFTINALAVEIGGDGQVIDLFGGRKDLEKKEIRAIRAGSFVEDPRRMFRAVRFAVRFGFRLNLATELEIAETAKSGIHDRIGGSRLRAELHYIFAHKKAAEMLRSLNQLGALRCIDPSIHLPQDFSLQLRRLKRWIKLFDSTYPIPQAGEKLLLSYAELAHPKLLALLKTLEEWELNLPLPSQVVKVLRNYEAIALFITAVKYSKWQRRILWQYFTTWKSVKPILTSEDLKNLGCPEGKIMGVLLSQIRDATLDHKITTKQDALNLAKKLLLL